MSRLTVLSLFDGIGGFPLAFERAGVKTVATVEIDKPAAAISARHFPDATHFDDVTKVTGDELRATGFVPDRGIITAGFPCQDLSVAGKRAGLAGSRSGLWWDVVRLLDETRARWFLGENVPGLLSSNRGRDMGAVLGSLGELGYGFAYRVLDAQWFGVPQRRRRVFIVGHLGEPFTAATEVLFEFSGGAGDSAAGSEAGTGVAGAVTGGTGVLSNGGGLVPALVSRYAKGTDSDATDALIVTPLSSRQIGTEGGPQGSLLSAGGGGSYSLVSIQSSDTPVGVAENERGEIREMDIAGTVSTGGGKPGSGYQAVREGTIVRRLTELECERLQGYPDGWTEGQSGAARYRQLGNSVAVPVVEWIARRMVAVDGEIA